MLFYLEELFDDQSGSFNEYYPTHYATKVFAHPTRSDAVVMYGLLSAIPNHPLIPRLRDSLIGRMQNGEWGHSQANLWGMLALLKYYQVIEAGKNSYRLHMWLNKQSGPELSEKSGEVVQMPLSWILQQHSVDGQEGAVELIAKKSGMGAVYCSLLLQYATSVRAVQQVRNGFTITRTYHDHDEVGGGLGVVTEGVGNRYLIKKGAVIRIVLTLSTAIQHSCVALVDYLPGGFEPVNEALKTAPKKMMMERKEKGKQNEDQEDAPEGEQSLPSLTSLPDDVLLHLIRHYLSPRDIARLEGTCQRLRWLGGDDYVWLNKLDDGRERREREWWMSAKDLYLSGLPANCWTKEKAKQTKEVGNRLSPLLSDLVS